MDDADDRVGRERVMRSVLALGRRGLGRTASNPSVAAMVVKDGLVLGRGVTAPGGRPHAEPIALAAAGAAARGASLFVTLEPCSHHGLTPPCVDAIVASGIARCIVATGDPDPRVAGRGLRLLQDAGVAVEAGVCEEEARRDHRGHIRRVTLGRPMVTLKLAQTADGFAAGAIGDRRLLITGPAANARVQMMRATHDAVVIGIGTALADDPLLTVRLPGLERVSPLRVVLDTHLRLPSSSRLVATAHAAPLLLIAGAGAPDSREAVLRGSGADVVRVPIRADGLDLAAVLRAMVDRGVTRLLCEGGPRLAAALVVGDLVDDIVLLTADTTLGRSGQPALREEVRDTILSSAHYRVIEDQHLGGDRLQAFERSEGSCSPA